LGYHNKISKIERLRRAAAPRVEALVAPVYRQVMGTTPCWKGISDNRIEIPID